MKILFTLALLTVLVSAEETQLFNGKDLTGWEGNQKFWSIEEGAITGTTTSETPTKGNTFLIWKGGEPSDFTLTLKYKMTPGDVKNFTNSGIQYRSKVIDLESFIVGGYQADLEYGDKYSGILYEEKGRGILAQSGQVVEITQADTPKKPSIEVVGHATAFEDIQAAIDKDSWNEYRIVAEGNRVQHFINGKLTVDVTDKTAEAPTRGVIALQLHAGPPMKIQFKDLILITK
ncbi:MAG: 3-keto-disaccharide hydrolase [Luteolibacter sp.]